MREKSEAAALGHALVALANRMAPGVDRSLILHAAGLLLARQNVPFKRRQHGRKQRRSHEAGNRNTGS